VVIGMSGVAWSYKLFAFPPISVGYLLVWIYCFNLSINLRSLLPGASGFISSIFFSNAEKSANGFFLAKALSFWLPVGFRVPFALPCALVMALVEELLAVLA